MTTREKFQVYRDGRPVEDYDGKRALRDGESMRVLFMDGDMSPVQRAVALDAEARDAARKFGLADGLDLHRPGQRYCTDAAANDARDAARAEMIADMCSAWQRKPAADGSRPVTGRQDRPGDVCNINGQSGRLNDRLECVPDKRQDSMPAGPVHDAVEGQRIRDAAWEAMKTELENAWRSK